MGSKRIPKDMTTRRNQQVFKWLDQGASIVDVIRLHRQKYGVGVTFKTIQTLRDSRDPTTVKPPFKRIPRHLILERDAQVIDWLSQKTSISQCRRLHREKYGCGVSFEKVKEIQADALKRSSEAPPKASEAPPKASEAPPKASELVLESPTGLVPAQGISDRLRAILAQLANAMAQDGISKVMVEKRTVEISFTPNQQVFEV